MLTENDTFIQAVKGKKKVILTYFSGRQQLHLTRLCVPVKFSSDDMEDDSDCYFFWDSDADTGERLLALTPSEIKNMVLSDETFDPADYIIPEKE